MKTRSHKKEIAAALSNIVTAVMLNKITDQMIDDINAMMDRQTIEEIKAKFITEEINEMNTASCIIDMHNDGS